MKVVEATITVGAIVRAPALTTYRNFQFDWEDQLGLVVRIDDRKATKGFLHVLMQKTARVCVFSPDILTVVGAK